MANAATRDIPFANALFVLAVILTILAGAMLLPVLVAIGESEPLIASAFAGSCLTGVFFGGGLMFALPSPGRPALMRENLLLLILAWPLMAFFAAMPLWLCGAASTVIRAFFEATSALTTTGASLLGAPEQQSPAILIWLAELQWLGGYATILMGATIVSALGTAGQDVQRGALPLGQSGPVFDRFFHIARGVAQLYAGGTAIALLAIWAGGVPFFDALCFSLSGIATGGLSTTSAGLAPYHAPLAEITLVLLMLFGAMNFQIHWTAFRQKSVRGFLRVYRRDPEFWLLIAGSILAAILFFSARAGRDMGHSGFVLFNAVSIVTTSGFWAGPVSQPTPAIALGAIGLAFVGGASISTAGGLKLVRLWLLLSTARVEMHRLVHPRRASVIRFRGRTLDEDTMRGMWASFAGYIGLLAAVTLALPWFGLDFAHALAAAVSCLTNTGPLYVILSGGGAPYGSLSEGGKLLLSAVMIAGRLEVLVLLAMFDLSFWRD